MSLTISLLLDAEGIEFFLSPIDTDAIGLTDYKDRVKVKLPGIKLLLKDLSDWSHISSKLCREIVNSASKHFNFLTNYVKKGGKMLTTVNKKFIEAGMIFSVRFKDALTEFGLNQYCDKSGNNAIKLILP